MLIKKSASPVHLLWPNDARERDTPTRRRAETRIARIGADVK